MDELFDRHRKGLEQKFLLCRIQAQYLARQEGFPFCILTSVTPGTVFAAAIARARSFASLLVQTSGSSNSNFRIDRSQFDSSVVDLHLPVDASLLVVDVRRPSRDFG